MGSPLWRKLGPVHRSPQGSSTRETTLLSFLDDNSNEQFLNQIVTVNFIQQLITSSAAGWKRSSKALPKAKLEPKKGSRSLLGGLIHYSFLNPGKTIISEKYVQQIDEMR